MCLPAAGLTAAQAATATLAISAATFVTTTAMGIMSAQAQASQAQASLNMQAQQQMRNQQMQRQQMIQAQDQQRQSMELAQRQQQDQYNLQVQQANISIANQYNQQRRQVEQERALIQARHAADRLNAQRSKENTEDQKRFNNEAANKIYQQEQTKITEAKRKAAFCFSEQLSPNLLVRKAQSLQQVELVSLLVCCLTMLNVKQGLHKPKLMQHCKALWNNLRSPWIKAICRHWVQTNVQRITASWNHQIHSCQSFPMLPILLIL